MKSSGRPREIGRVVSVVGPSEESTRTRMVVSLARQLSKAGKQVVVLDLGDRAAASTLLHSWSRSSSIRTYRPEIDLTRGSLQDRRGPASSPLRDARGDVMLIDCPNGLTSVTAWALTFSESVLATATATLDGITALEQLILEVESVRQSSCPQLSPNAIVPITPAHLPASAAAEAVWHLRARHGDYVAPTLSCRRSPGGPLALIGCTNLGTKPLAEWLTARSLI